MQNLVLGSDGFVGVPFCSYLKTLGEDVIPYDIRRNTIEDLRFAQLDLELIDKVYFLAWDVGGAKYLYQRQSQFSQLDWNLKLLLNVMPQLEKTKKPFLFISSQLAEEYDTVYGVTKRLGEVWTHLLGGVRVRLWNVYGVYEEPSIRSHVVSDFVHQALTKSQINLLTTGEEERQFVYIDDVCEAFHIALSSRLDGVYDVTSFEWIRVLDVANLIAKHTNANVVPGIKQGSTPLTPIQGKIPGWMPKVSIEEGIENVIRDARIKLKLL